MYKLYLDKSENFECEVAVKNASLKNSVARLVVESNGLNLIFKGTLDGNKCVIPIRRMRGLLEENTSGNMYLEVIVEDTYFKPWKSEFVTEEHTSVKVKVNEQKEPSKKAIVEVNVPSQNNNSIIVAKEIASLCNSFGINKSNFIKEERNNFKQILVEYFKQNQEYLRSKTPIIEVIPQFLR